MLVALQNLLLDSVVLALALHRVMGNDVVDVAGRRSSLVDV
jgi:hypothetical protein